ncbi:hypothetical protein MMC10_005273 [Thelotrema lepadinum]|nr:hypothetical protein [Thelotrema lepadinum]
MDSPSLRTPPQQPVSFDATPSDLLAEAKGLNAESTAVIESIVASAKSSAPTFEYSMEPFIQRENKRLARSSPIKFYASTSTDKSVREASNAATKILEEHNLDLFHNRELFAIVHAVWKDRDRLDAAAEHYMEKLHSDFEEKGCAIEDPAKQARFQAIQKRLGDLQRELAMNINGDTTGLWFRHTDLEGLPEDALLRFQRAAEKQIGANNLPVDTDEKMYWVSMKEPDRIAVCTHARNQRTRRLVTRTFANRLPERIPIYREVFTLRDEAARIMGFGNHAAFRMKYKMLGSVEPVESFLKQVCEQLQRPRDETLQKMMEIQEQDAKDEGISKPELGLTEGDTLFYGRRIQEKMCSQEQKKSAEYFPLDSVLHGLFEIFEHIFGIKVFQVEAQEHQIMHPTVKMYTLWDNDKSQDFMGYLYLDLFPRDGKFTHAGTY